MFPCFPREHPSYLHLGNTQYFLTREALSALSSGRVLLLRAPTATLHSSYHLPTLLLAHQSPYEAVVPEAWHRIPMFILRLGMC